jgi:hypothetical protein
MNLEKDIVSNKNKNMGIYIYLVKVSCRQLILESSALTCVPQLLTIMKVLLWQNILET